MLSLSWFFNLNNYIFYFFIKKRQKVIYIMDNFLSFLNVSIIPYREPPQASCYQREAVQSLLQIHLSRCQNLFNLYMLYNHNLQPEFLRYQLLAFFPPLKNATATGYPIYNNTLMFSLISGR